MFPGSVGTEAIQRNPEQRLDAGTELVWIRPPGLPRKGSEHRVVEARWNATQTCSKSVVGQYGPAEAIMNAHPIPSFPLEQHSRGAPNVPPRTRYLLNVGGTVGR